MITSLSVIMSLTTLGIPNAWQVALGIVFISGVLFMDIFNTAGTLTGVSEQAGFILSYSIADGMQ